MKPAAADDEFGAEYLDREWGSRVVEVQNDRRPVWEPPLHRSLDYPEEGSVMRSDDMECLAEQGCQFPGEHYRPDHDCLIPGIRLQCIREIRRWHRHRHVVALIPTKLPKELILEILEYVVCQTQPSLQLQHKRSLATAARSIIGESPAIDQLQPLAEEAILSTSVINLLIAYQGDGGHKTAILAPFVRDLRHPIRHFELFMRFNIPSQRQSYPAALYIATAGVGSLVSQLPRLQTLQLKICIMLDSDPGSGVVPDVLNFVCRKGFSGTTTYKQGMIDLVDAARAQKQGPCVSLELRFEWAYGPPKDGRPRPEPKLYRVEAGTRPALEVVEEANAKHMS